LLAAQGSATRSYPTYSLALQLFDEPHGMRCSPHRTAALCPSDRNHQPGRRHSPPALCAPNQRIVNYLKGLNVLDEALSFRY